MSSLCLGDHRNCPVKAVSIFDRCPYGISQDIVTVAKFNAHVLCCIMDGMFDFGRSISGSAQDKGENKMLTRTKQSIDALLRKILKPAGV